MFRVKVCGNCRHCRLDVKALNCGVLIDKCAVFKKHILHPFLGGFRCKFWRTEDEV